MEFLLCILKKKIVKLFIIGVTCQLQHSIYGPDHPCQISEIVHQKLFDISCLQVFSRMAYHNYQVRLLHVELLWSYSGWHPITLLKIITYLIMSVTFYNFLTVKFIKCKIFSLSVKNFYKSEVI